MKRKINHEILSLIKDFRFWSILLTFVTYMNKKAKGAQHCHCRSCCSTGLDAVCDLSLQVCLTDVPAALVLCWMELVFFTVAGMGVWFGFMLKTTLIRQGCFSSASAALVVKMFSAPPLLHQ